MKTFLPKRYEVAGYCRIHNEKLYDIIRVMKSRSMRWAEHVALMAERKGVYRVLVGDTVGKETTWKT